MFKFSYCADLLRRSDPAQFSLCLFAPFPGREGLFNLYALLHEIRRIPQQATDPAAAQIRLKWWHDRIDDLYNETVPAGHPVLEAFLLTKPRQGKEALENYIAAVQELLFAEDAATLFQIAERLKRLSDKLACYILDIPVEENADLAAVAAADMLLGVTRRLAEQKEPDLPAVFWQDKNAVKDKIQEVRQSAAVSHNTQKKPQRSKKGHAVYLSQALAMQQLQQIEKVGYDLRDNRLTALPPFSTLRLILRAGLGQF
ncbi:MAG: hypothetical protein EP349_06510 [Alphaproteobacteria bacterium]|nr:MAG: hypothetical protein EP349_06510 [Alphaproteobacteria bacterium]